MYKPLFRFGKRPQWFQARASILSRLAKDGPDFNIDASYNYKIILTTKYKKSKMESLICVPWKATEFAVWTA